MRKSRFLASALAVTSSLAIAHPAVAQYQAQTPAQTSAAQPYQPQMAPTPTPDADALADAMRQLASNPRDLTALITAGELSLKVGDASGAAALFKRAEQVDPMNGRVKAGMARILVSQERPGEALRYFDQAVGYGLDPRTFAGDRGLAYDLIGQQERAQRDYRLALKGGDSDEVRRRYALSLAISGNQLGAFEQLEPLTRRNDRPAWRARAFVLAMTGDVPGANRIAQGMMPPGMAAGLAPFFTRLPTLSPIDKAFAVHFGEVTPTPQRLADSRLTPVLAALGPDPDARPPIVVPSPPPQNPRGKRGRGRAAPVRVEVARAAPRPAMPTPAAPSPGFGSAGTSPTDPVRTAAAPTTTAPIIPAPAPAPAPVQLARADIDPIQKATLADYERVQRVNDERARRANQRALAPSTQTAGTGVAPTPVRPTPAPVTVAATPPTPTQTIPTTPSPSSQTQIAAVAPTPSAPLTRPAPTTPSPATQVAATPTPAYTPPAPAPATQLATATPPATTSSTPTPLAVNEDSILARIVKGLSIPGNELGVAPPPTPAPVATPPVEVASAAPKPEPVAVASKTPAPTPTRATTRRQTTPEAKPAATEVADATPTTRRGARTRTPAAETDEAPAPTTRAGRRGARTQTAATDETDAPTTARTRSGKRADTRTAASDDADEPAPATRGRRGARAVAAKDEDATPAKGKRGATARTAAADKDKKAEKPAAEPSRIWVQVAGGANEKDLGKAYAGVQSRTPALRGRQAYSTPLRATNRVVTGPFKTDAEARAFVNQLAKQGVSAFPFTSDKGQKMTRIPPK